MFFSFSFYEYFKKLRNVIRMLHAFVDTLYLKNFISEFMMQGATYCISVGAKTSMLYVAVDGAEVALA